MMKFAIDKKTLIMGILNVTPDSFSDGGLYNNADSAVGRVEIMLSEGADFIDVGGESTRPGSKKISEEEELTRVIPILKAIRKRLGNKFLISIDTYKSEVAKTALQEGADFVNSLAGFQFDPRLSEVVKKYHCPIVIYHIRGNPETMQQGEITYQDIIKEITAFFKTQIKLGISHGLSKNQFLLDPGIGFGKTVEQNLEIIRRLKEFKKLGLPIVIGISRKSHLKTIFEKELHLKEISPEKRLEGALAETAIAALNGASIVRTHDVLQTKKFLTVLDLIKNG